MKRVNSLHRMHASRFFDPERHSTRRPFSRLVCLFSLTRTRAHSSPKRKRNRRKFSRTIYLVRYSFIHSLFDSIFSLQEFLLAIDVTSSGTPEEKLKWAFRMYDVDGNGVIDIQEMTKIVQVSDDGDTWPTTFGLIFQTDKSPFRLQRPKLMSHWNFLCKFSLEARTENKTEWFFSHFIGLIVRVQLFTGFLCKLAFRWNGQMDTRSKYSQVGHYQNCVRVHTVH